MTKKHLHWFAWINAFVIIGGLSIIGYLRFFDNSAPIVIHNSPIPTVERKMNTDGTFKEKKVFHTGEQLTYGLDYCKTTDIPAEMYASFIDTVKIDMPVVKIKSPVGCTKKIVDIYKVPAILPTGLYYLEVEAVYQVNPLREVRVRYRTQDFTIINTNEL